MVLESQQAKRKHDSYEKDHGMESVILMYAFLLLASLAEVLKIFKRGHFVSKLTTTVGPKKKPGRGCQEGRQCAS